MVNLKEGIFSYASAGHPAPIVVRLGEVEQLSIDPQKKNPALGLIPGSTFNAQSMSLDEIDRLLVFTDGLHEVENADGEQLGIEKVVQMLGNSKDTSLEGSLDEILEEARAYSDNGEFEDDVCLLAMDVGSGL